MSHLPCFWNSRRLGEAWDHVQEVAKEWRQRAHDLEAHHVENNNDMLVLCKSLLSKQATGLLLRTKYLGVVPELFCLKADTQAGAAECMRQVRARPGPEHDFLTQWIMQRLGADIERRAADEDASEALLREVRILKQCPSTNPRARGIIATRMWSRFGRRRVHPLA